MRPGGRKKRGSSSGQRPLVSVIVPAYNAEGTLRETLESALASTLAAIEIIIVDDGSTDRTGEIASALSADPRVRLVRQANRGLPGALNAGLAAARGEFVARLDADDVWHPTKLAKQIEVAIQPSPPDFIYTFYRYIDQQGRVLFDGPPQRFPRRALRRSVYETLIGTGSSMLMRRSALQGIGGFDERFRNSEDLLFQVKVAQRHTLGFVPEYLVGYRLHPNSLSQNADAMREVWFELRPSLKASFPQVPAYAHDWAHARRCMSMAEGFARAGQFRQGLRLLATALWSDPIWSSAYLTYRSGKLAKQAISPNLPPKQSSHFRDCDPAEPKDSRSALYGTEGALMGYLHERRVRRLSALDDCDS